MEPWKTTGFRFVGPASRASSFIPAGVQCGVEERRARNASPRLDARCVPWFHNGSASGGASSLLDRGGRGTMGLSGGRRAGQEVGLEVGFESIVMIL